MPSVGPVHTPSAADAEYPNFTGDVVADAVVNTDYVDQICDAAHVPYKVQNEILKHQDLLKTIGFNDPVNGYTLFDDFLNGGFIPDNTAPVGAGPFQLFANSTGGNWDTPAFIDSVHIGIMRLHTLASTSSFVWVLSEAPSYAIGNGAQSWEILMKYPAASNGTDRHYIRVGINDGSQYDDTCTDGLYFRVIDNVNGGKWQAVARSGSAETATDTGVTPTANTWVKLRIEINAAGTSAKFYINGTLVATITTHLPSSVTLEWLLSIKKSAGTTDVTPLFDYLTYQLGATGR